MTLSEQVDKRIAEHPDWRGITLSESDRISGPEFKRLVRAAVELNKTRKGARSKAKPASASAARPARTKKA